MTKSDMWHAALVKHVDSAFLILLQYAWFNLKQTHLISRNLVHAGASAWF